MNHVTVTGANGFIGSHVVRALLAQKRKVLAVVEPGSDTSSLDGLDVERFAADILDSRAMDQACSGAEALYHLAAVYRLWSPDPDLIYRVNVEGTTAVMLAAQKAKVKRIVHTSSIAAVGIREDGVPSDETIRFNLFDLANDYILTKHLSERVVWRFAKSGMPIVIVNPAFPFGPLDRAPTPTGRMLIEIASGRAPGHTAGGFNAVDVELVAQGHLLAEEKGRVGERYILGDHNVTFAEFNKLVAEVAHVSIPDRTIPAPVAYALSLMYEKVADHVTHRAPPITLKSAQYATRKVFFDVTRARNELGLPSRPLRDTMERTLAWFRQNGYLEKKA